MVISFVKSWSKKWIPLLFINKIELSNKVYEIGNRKTYDIVWQYLLIKENNINIKNLFRYLEKNNFYIKYINIIIFDIKTIN